MSEKQIAVRQDAIQAEPSGIIPRNMEELATLCEKICASRLAPKDLSTPEAVFVAISMGMEIGLKPMQALQSICVINGRPSVWGDAALALVKVHPDCEDVIESIEGKGEDGEGTTAICEVRRRGKVPVKRKFTKKMAETAGLWNKAIWKQYPMRMLQMRARAFALRDSFPDVLKGIMVREEVQDYQPARAHEVHPRTPLVLPGGEPLALEEKTTPEPTQEAPEAPREAGGEPPEGDEPKNPDGTFKF